MRARQGGREPGGRPVLPGSYTIRLSAGKDTTTQVVDVITDPRVGIDTRNLKQLIPIYERQMEITNSVTAMMDRIRESKQIVESVTKMLDMKNETHKALSKSGKAMNDSLDVLQHLIVNKRGLQGIVRSPDILSAKVGAIGRYLYSNMTGPNDSHDYLLDYAEKETEKVLEKVNAFFKDDWPDYQTAVEDADLSLFKEYKPIKID